MKLGMEEQKIIDAKTSVKIDYLPVVNYSMMNSGVDVCRSIVIENRDERDWNKILVRIRGNYLKENSCHLEQLKQGLSLQVNSLKIEPDINILCEITEKISTSFVLSVEEDGTFLFEQEFPIELLPYDEWAGSSVMPEQLAAFVVPNCPILAGIKIAAAGFLEKWTGSSAFDEYQTQDRNRVRAQVAAIYEALRSEGIIYSAPPASFESTGQRIRLSDKVLAEKMGTCIDTSLLVASLLEAVGIYPIVVMLKEHTMVGAWLTPKVFPQMVCDDLSYLLKETADGNNNIVLLESTAITSTEPVDFEDAVRSAMLKLGDESRFLFFIDIHRCRLGNVRPLPQRIKKDGIWTFDNIEGHTNATEQINHLSHYDLRLESSGNPTTKQMIWERKLLDFTLRNNLLNTKLGRKVIPFISFDIDHLEDHLQNGEDYHITPSPGKKLEPNNDGMYDSSNQAYIYRDFVSESIRDNKIVSYLTVQELQNSLKYVYRTARTSIEENGANSLFLALGLLRWYETSKSEQPRYAPILLLPVDIIRRSGNNYVIRKRDEDILLNITLVELLKQNFRINLDVLKELPKDDSGVDVKLIFTYFRRAVIEQKKWNVLEESMLGLFSFNKFVMWNDIHSNADKLKENPIVASLIDNRNRPEIETVAVDARNIDRENAPIDFAVPMDADSSQMEAIVESGKGKSFILHGPPGTGKSQTITNMIANALYNGKRVLFVAEKMAALSVVQSRLQKIHLDPFCLELHSNKATKKHFLEQMERVLNITKIRPPEEYERFSNQLFAERQEFIGYMDALHRKKPNGYSLYECICNYLDIIEDEVKEGLPHTDIITKDYVNRCKSQVKPICAVLDIIGQPNRHSLFGLEPADNRKETLEGIQSLLADFRGKYDSFENQRNALNSKIPLNLETESDIEWLEMFASIVSLEKRKEELKDSILSNYNENILKLNIETNRREWGIIKKKWFIPRYFAKKKYLKSLQAYGQIFESDIEDILINVGNYQETNKAIKENSEFLSSYSFDRGLAYQERVDAYDIYVGTKGHARRDDFINSVASIVAINKDLTKISEKINEQTVSVVSKEVLIGNSAKWLSNYFQIRDWYHWVDKKQELKREGMFPVIEMVEKGMEPGVAVNAFVKGMFKILITEAVDEDRQLRMFNGLIFRQQIEKYKHDTLRFQELCKQELYYKLASRVPSASFACADSSEISILKRNIANGGRGNSIRSIIDDIPTLLPRLCPCMLMSPISVAQYIDINSEKFDLVIFDEASQMPTSESVGAIARGKALVVVGDSKQMPPTSFFTSNQVDEEEADIDDMESILDDCITLSLCEHRLNWHYRSKHESLIAFSNSQYYNNGLYTFPSVDDRVAKVRLVPVNGVYDKGHTRSNREESKAIVQEIMRRLSDPELRKYSIGVVAFSKVQGDLIEDDLTDELDRHPEIKEIAYNENEPIFIKNLENVQGDERDVILFSVGYGADKYGKVSMNFGPLNNSGGERRLNVAISRARYEMMVFSTLKSSQIDLKRSSAKGVEGLKRFLEFAETGNLPMLSENSIKSSDSIMVNQICKALESHGYITEPFVGKSDFKIDIAVSTKENPDKYILGILCDGRTYFETKTTRDREIVQPKILRMLNWRVFRVYSIDWYENRERALSQILEELKSAESGIPQEIQDGDTKPFVFDNDKIKEEKISETETRNQGQRPYVECNIANISINKEFYNPFDEINGRIIRKILKVEQPVTESYLCKVLARTLGFGHAGVNIQRAVSIVASNLYQDPLSVGGILSFWLSEDDARNFKGYRAPSLRSIMEIPAIEIANAIKETLKEEFSLPSDRIPTIVARKLGFSNAGAKINETIKAVLFLLAQNSEILVNNGFVSLKEKA